MYQFFTSLESSAGVAVATRPEVASEIERFRARNRKVCRVQRAQQQQHHQVEDLDVEDGRTRKIPSKWRHQQQQQSNQQDSDWLAADADAGLTFSAFDFSASPELFMDRQSMPEAQSERCPCDNNSEMHSEAPSAEIRSGSLWQRRLQNARQPAPSLGHDALWDAPTSMASYGAAYHQPQYFA